MNRRTARAAATFLVGVMAAVIMPLTLMSTPASAATEQFNLELSSGQIKLRGSAEARELEGPTTLSGTNTDGQLTDVELDTPVIEIVQPVPDFNTTAYIDAEFSMVNPGTGSINEDGDVTVQLTLAVDLHIVVPILPAPRDCRAAPINITLTSTAPHDGDRVTLRDVDFTVPPVADNPPACDGLVAGPVNETLAGAGHFLSMTLDGPLTPPEPGEPTATALAVSSPTSDFGDEVTLTSTVTPNPAVPGAPAITGLVTFYDGTIELGSAPVAPDGTAVLATSALQAGTRQLRAAYGGAPPDWKPSESVGTITHTVIADPLISTNASGEVQPGGPGREFDVTVNNTGFGEALEDARVEVAITRAAGTAPIGPNGPTPRIVLSRVDSGGVATPVPLTLSGFPGTLGGDIGDTTTWALEPGEEHTERLRLEVASGVAVGPLSVTFNLVTGAGPGEQTLGTSSGTVNIVNAAREATTITAGDPGFPPFIPEIPPVTPIVRQGTEAEMSIVLGPDLNGVRPEGTLSFFVDGVPVLSQHRFSTEPNAGQWLSKVPIVQFGGAYLLQIPRNTPTGTRQVTVRYSGNSLFAPTQETYPITVEPAVGEIYECVGQGFTSGNFRANVVVEGDLPPVWATGQEIDLDRIEVSVLLSRTIAQQELLTSAESPDQSQTILRLDLGPNGTITPAEATRSNSIAMQTGDGLGTDSILELSGGTGSVLIDHDPGTEEEFTLDRITTTFAPGGFLSGMVCTPESSAHVLGTVTAAGTTLAVSPGGPVAAGSAVELTATALPAAPGMVEFRDGTTTVGVAPVDANGVARVITDDLAAGHRSLTARFYGGPVATSPSEPVEIHVVGDCPPVEPGNGAAVRLVYMELLGRCADPAGYAYWKGQLDSGAATREQFASAIAGTKEARMVIVDDGYRQMLERPAEQGGKEYWADLLAKGAGYDDLLAALASSGPEYSNLAGGTIDGYVIRSYEQILDRTPSEEEVDYWADFIERRGSAGKKALILSFFGSDETLGTIVTAAYQEILDRDPTPEELAAGIALIKGNVNRSKLYGSLIGLQEFFDRAQTFPDFD